MNNAPISSSGFSGFSIRTRAVAVVFIATLITAAIAIGLQYHFSREMAVDNALGNYQSAAQNTSEFIESLDTRAVQVASILSHYPGLIDDENDFHRMRALFAQAMRNNPIYYSVYVGFPNGDFYELINLDEKGVDRRAQFQASADDRWIANRVREINGKRVRELQFLDDAFNQREFRREPSQYDVRQRQWFVDAKPNKVRKSKPYIFQYSQIPGKTFSIQLPDSQVVLGIDIALKSFSNYLHSRIPDNTSEVYVYSNSGETLGSNLIPVDDQDLPAVTPLELTENERAYIKRLGRIKISNQLDWAPIDYAVEGQPRGYAVDMIRVISQQLGLEFELINGDEWRKIVNKFEQGNLDIIHPVTSTHRNKQRGFLSQPILHIDMGLVTRQGDATISHLQELAGKTLAIPQGWSSINPIKKAYPDIQILEVESTRAALEAVRDGKATATLDAAAVLHYVAQQYFIRGVRFTNRLDIGDAELSKEFRLLIRHDLTELGQLIDKAIAAQTPRQKNHLIQKWLSEKGVAKIPANFSTVPYEILVNAVQNPEQRNKLLPIKLHNTPHFVYVSQLRADDPDTDYFAAIIPVEKILTKPLEKVSASIWLTLICLVILLPISWFYANPIVRPIHQLAENSAKVRERRYSEITFTPSRIKEIDELADAMEKMARSIETYEQEQRDLLDAFIQLIAEAIDEKSPYTGGHCERVPELAMMLVDEAIANQSSAFKDFSFNNDEEYREFKIGAWLHDCGKIIVPEHIVDKGSKLETIYNRIHEIRLRFELLWRDAEIHYWKALQDAPKTKPILEAELISQQQKLQEDFAFIAKLNVGSEFVKEDDLQRLRELATIPWLRHFDDRLGLSPVEELRVDKNSPVQLPAQEQLLADKPEHIIKRYRPTEYDPALGIRMEVPENLYNLGEIYNLSIGRGTLSAEDRFKINEHIIGTIRMLEKLPFPQTLKKVPRYASTHHETLKGTGYPRKLTAADLSIPERIMVLADIFEALTASDRPYKKAKSVSASIDIMYKMVLDEHVDRNVFELFLRSGIYQRYAEKYLLPEQQDSVDIEKYLVGL